MVLGQKGKSGAALRPLDDVPSPCSWRISLIGSQTRRRYAFRPAIPSSTATVSVGKRSGRHSKDQRTIDAMLVEAAAAGNRVVRLKGGDPSIFGRSAEELAALREAGYIARICPGITTACAAAASAGISLTLRSVARDVRFVTAHSKRGAALDIDWHSLANGGSTLAFYMGRDAAGEIMRGLMHAGMAGDIPVMIACDVSGTGERRLATRLDLLELATQSFAADAPTLILVGEAVDQGTVELAISEAHARQMHG